MMVDGNKKFNMHEVLFDREQEGRKFLLFMWNKNDANYISSLEFCNLNMFLWKIESLYF